MIRYYTNKWTLCKLILLFS